MNYPSRFEIQQSITKTQMGVRAARENVKRFDELRDHAEDIASESLLAEIDARQAKADELLKRTEEIRDQMLEIYLMAPHILPNWES